MGVAQVNTEAANYTSLTNSPEIEIRLQLLAVLLPATSIGGSAGKSCRQDPHCADGVCSTVAK